jgi:hypothetical protein
MSDMIWVLALGLVGGFAHELLNGGITLPLLEKKENSPLYLQFGSLGEILLGAGAAFVTYVSSTPSAFLQICFLAFISGIGGSAVLKAYVNGQEAMKNQTKVQAAEAYVVAHAQKGREVRVSAPGGSGVNGGTADAETMAEFMKILKGI